VIRGKGSSPPVHGLISCFVFAIVKECCSWKKIIDFFRLHVKAFLDYEKIIANQIKKSRESAHLSQTELGIGALGFNKSDTNKAQKVISKIETGARDITAEEIYQIAKYLKKPLSYFFGGKQEEDKSDFKSCLTQEEI